MHRSAALIGILALVLAACASPAASPSATEPPTPSATEAATPSASPSAEESESAEPSEEATAEEVRVRLESSNFDPTELTIPAGTTVLILKADSYTHTVTEGTGGQAVDDPIEGEGTDGHGSAFRRRRSGRGTDCARLGGRSTRTRRGR